MKEYHWTWLGRLGIIIGILASAYAIYVNYHKHRKINELDALEKDILNL